MKHEEKLELISMIDEKIIDRNTKKRHVLWHKTLSKSRKHPRGKNVTISLLAATLALTMVAFGTLLVMYLSDQPVIPPDPTEAIVSIELTSTKGDTAVYTITYKNGETATLDISDKAPDGSGAKITGVTFDENSNVYLNLATGKLLSMGRAVGQKKGDATLSGYDGRMALSVPAVLYLGTPQDATTVAGVSVDEEENMSYHLDNGKHLALGKVHHKTPGGQDESMSIACINESGELVLGFASGETVNLGRVVGRDGKDGVGIAGINLSPEGELSVTLTNGTVLNLGNIKGIGIAESKINDAGELVLTYTDGNSVNLGRVVGERGEDGVGIASININDAGELTIILTDGTNLNLGVIKGQDGKSAYELYKEKYGYEGTEEEWLFDLVNGNLATKVKYPVTFDSAGGSEVPMQEIEEGCKVIEPEPPTRAGYTFLGWFVGKEKWNFSGHVVTEKTVLTAKWEIVTYTITYNNIWKIPDAVTAYTVEDEVTIATYNTSFFLGWTYEGQETPQRNVVFPKGTLGDIVLTAHYSSDQLPVRAGTIAKIHDGRDSGYIDIITPEIGTEIYAIADATVLCIQQDGYGRLLLDMGDNMLLFYGVMSAELPDNIYVGAKVSKGDLIGWSVDAPIYNGQSWVQMCGFSCPEEITDEMIDRANQGNIWDFPGLNDPEQRLNPLRFMSDEVLAALGYTPEEE